MRWRERARPVRMQRVAVVCPADALRDALARVASAGTVELDMVTPAGTGADRGEAGRRLQRLAAGTPPPRLARAAPDLAALEAAGRADLLAGEAELAERAAQAVVRGSVAAAVGWTPAAQLPALAERLAEVGAAVAPLDKPPGVDPPSLLAGAASRVPLVQTYAAVPYSDVDPSGLAAVAYVVMFGMMFADAGHGLVLLAAAALLRLGRPRWLAARLGGRLAGLRAGWPYLAGAGAASAVFGLLYGEFFGPTGVVPALWLEPLAHPAPLLAAGVGVGALLLAVAYAVGSVNRWREGGWQLALYAPTGVAGSLLFCGLGLVAAGARWRLAALLAAGVLAGLAGLALSFAGRLASSGGGTAGMTQASVELFDSVIRLGSNVVSFARLAAFGLTHAALGGIVWEATRGLWHRGALPAVAAVAVFAVGNVVSFGLEALVAAVQALRLEYYELFSRIFAVEGRPFRPWHIPLVDEEAQPCLSG
jgi:V/A-type H+/Na+-transporting ATPase subunit I